jgi:hypothetical protein
MKTIKFLFADLNQDERQFLGGAAVMVAGLAFIFWLTTTVSRPVMDHQSIDQQTYQEQSYELSSLYDKYVNRIYHEKYGK